MVALNNPHKPITSTPTTASQNHPSGDDVVWPSRSSRMMAAATEPIITRSPWAKLISSMMP
jgi:hypothetical protein